MRNPLSRWLAVFVFSVLAFGCKAARAQQDSTLESQHFRIVHEKYHAQLAGEILEIAESVWPTLAKAYQSYEHYERIDIVILDQSDEANGFAIYPWSQVAIFAPHMDWVLRNRQVWLRNVVTHELAHIFSLRRAARLSPFDYVDITGRTYNARDQVNFSFSVPWVPLIAPNWYVEGIAQFEAEQNGNDNYDSQRDMLLRDAWLTGTLPTLEYIETFDAAEDWIQGERVYNTGYAFLRYLKDRYGVEKVRKLAFSKPFFNFASAAEEAFGKPMPELFEEFRKSLAEKYADFKGLPVDPVADPDMPGSYQQNLAFSSDGRYMAWLGNDESRRFPANFIYWKSLMGNGEVRKSGGPAAQAPAASPQEGREPNPSPDPKPEGLAAASRRWTSVPGIATFRSPNPTLDLGRRYHRLMKPSDNSPSPARMIHRNHQHGLDRSDELGSEGLEFNRTNDRLLTTRQDAEYSAYTDIWEYEFKSNKSEKKKWRRLTWEERASYPSYHPTKDLIVFVRKQTGTTNLAVLDSAGRIGQLTNFTGGQQVFNPRYNPKGDSIYFTLQVEDKEAIAVIAADAPRFDPFLSLRDSAAFPDSVNLAKGQKLTFITHPKAGAIRHIRFAGDTLFWSSNMLDTGASVYNVYARLPGDSAVLRATSARTQALEPLAHGGKLYYQGFQRQRFLLFQRPLAFAPTGKILQPYVDTVSAAKPKTIEYSKAFATGVYSGRKIAHEIIPFLSLAPQFVENNRSYTDLAMGLALNLGDPMGNWSQSFAGAVAKRLDLSKPITYQLSYSGALAGEPIRHTRVTFPMQITYSLYHDILQYEDLYKERDGYRQGADTVAVRARTAVTTVASRDAINATLPLPYEFSLDAGFFWQRLSQNMTQRVQFYNGDDGSLLETQDQMNVSLFNDATQHRNFNLGLGWSHSWMMQGTYLPTGFSAWGSARKWWANYQSGFAVADSSFIFAVSHEGDVAPQYVLTGSQFNPWSVDAGMGGVLSQGKSYSLFANLQLGTFLNKFPMEIGPADLGQDSLSEETANSLWVMTYQLGYSMMPGYPYNFRYRGRDIMEGTAFGRLQYGVDIPLRGLGFFIPWTPVSSFQQFTLTALGNAGSTFILPADRIYDAVENGRHNLLLDFGVRLAATFNIYHQYPFTIYAQGFKPYNRLRASRLYWYDYPHTGQPNADGSPSAAQLANAPKDREEHMKLVQDPRFFVGFTLGY